MSLKYLNNLMGMDDYDDQELLKTTEELQFEYANVANPSKFVLDLAKSKDPEREIAKFHKGTTTLGFVF